MSGSDMRHLERLARRAGWAVTRSARGHVCFTPPDPARPKIFTSGTPSDWRAARNLRRDLRHAGLEV